MKIASYGLAILIVLILTSCRIDEYYKNKKKVTTFTIGSGSKNAMFYPVANSLCKVFNKYNEDKTIFCKPLLSSGAEYNLTAVNSGKFDMGITQASLQYDAYNGLNEFSGKPYKNLRTLFEVHNEYLTIISNKDNIKSFSDLFGKKVNIGNPGSGSRILFSKMIGKLGWEPNDFEEIYEESGSDIKKVLCVSDKADAAVYIVGHPNQSFKFMLDNCNAKLVSLSDSEIKSFISISPKEFHKSFIPKNTYNKVDKDIETFASKTILTASSKLDKKIVHNFVKIIFEHKEELIKMQPELSVINLLTKNDPNLAPLHEGLKNLGSL